MRARSSLANHSETMEANLSLQAQTVIQTGKFTGCGAQLESSTVNNSAWQKLTVLSAQSQFKTEYFISPSAEVFKPGRVDDFGASYRPRLQKALLQLPPWEAEYILTIRALFKY